MRFSFQHGSFDLPKDARDDSVQVLTVPIEDRLPLSLVIRWQTVDPSGNVESMLQQAMQEKSAREPDFSLSWVRSHSVDGHPAAIAATSTGTGEATLSERRLHVRIGDRLLVLVARAHSGFGAIELDKLNRIVSSLRLTPDSDGGSDGR